MDPAVDQANAPVAIHYSAVPADPGEAQSTARDDGEPTDADPSAEGLADLESELYCSTREMGIGAVSFGPVDDD
jgi:hypothetical protein